MTKSGRKVVKKLKKLDRKGKLRRHTVDKFKDIKARKAAGSRKRALDIEDDWIGNRLGQDADNGDDDEDILPLDMLDADLEWTEVGETRAKRKRKDENNEDSLEENTTRNFVNDDSNLKYLLPIKLAGGEIVTRSQVVEDVEEEVIENQAEENKVEQKPMLDDEDVGLSAAELCAKRQRLLADYKKRVANTAHQLMAEPTAQIHRLKELLQWARGENVESLVRESVQKLATVSLSVIFIDIIPGAHIRLPTELEMAQKLKKETKKVYDFEAALLRNYKKYLQHLENCCKPFGKKRTLETELLSSSFGFKIGLLALDCLCKLLITRPHFNFRSNIIAVVVRLTTSGISEVITKCCETIKTVFKDDIVGEVTLEATRAIGQLVHYKPHAATPDLLYCLISLRIKEVDKGENKKEKEALKKKKFQIKRERKSKKAKKYDKQLKKLEKELTDMEAAESQSTKLKWNTLTMRHVFATYFRVLRRLHRSTLLPPVLEGLSKFAHLINIDFFDDLVASMHDLVQNATLRPLDAIRCIHTVFVLLSGEGQALNIDPYRFYRSMYAQLPRVALETNPQMQRNETELCVRTLDLMLNGRRKQLSIARVAAFVKRILLLVFTLPTDLVLAFLAAIRTYFVSHPRLADILLDAENQGSGNYLPAIDDPDHCNGQSTSILLELDALAKHPNLVVEKFVAHLRNGLPSTGKHRLLPVYATKVASAWALDRIDETIAFPDAINFGKKQKQKSSSSSGHLCARLESWIKEQ